MQASGERLPTRVAVVLDVPTESGDSEVDLADSRRLREFDAPEHAEHIEFVLRNDRKRRLLRGPCRFTSDQEHAVGNRSEDCEKIDEGFVVLKLPALEVAARLDCFVVLLDDPARSIVVNDGELLLDRVDGLGCIEVPFDRGFAVGRVYFPNVNDVDLERVRRFESRVRALSRWTFKRDRRCSKGELCAA